MNKRGETQRSKGNLRARWQRPTTISPHAVSCSFWSCSSEHNWLTLMNGCRSNAWPFSISLSATIEWGWTDGQYRCQRWDKKKLWPTQLGNRSKLVTVGAYEQVARKQYKRQFQTHWLDAHPLGKWELICLLLFADDGNLLGSLAQLEAAGCWWGFQCLWLFCYGAANNFRHP